MGMTDRRPHGGDLSSLRTDGRQWLDLSTGINPVPYPWQERLSSASIREAMQRLPQAAATADLLNAFMAYSGVADQEKGRENWVVGPGSQALIEALPRLWQRGRPVIVPQPTYGEHAFAWARAGYQVATPDACPRAFARGTILVLTNPNNPDGRRHDPADLLSLADRLAAVDGFLVVDEAFADLVPARSLAGHPLPDNVILLRSFGKFFGLAGMRIGLCRVPALLKAGLDACLPLWATDGLALAIAATAYGDSTWIGETRQRLAGDMTALRTTLARAGLEPIGGTDLFCLTRHPRAGHIHDHLRARAVHVRRFDAHPDWLRFGLGPQGSMQQLETALEGDWLDD
jgi:cobalamin biosynthetic protein CobC